MITYKAYQKTAWICLLTTVLFLGLSYFFRNIDFLRQFFIVGVLVFLVGMLPLIFFPTLIGQFISIREEADGFEFDYLNKDGTVNRTEKIELGKLVNFSLCDHSTQVLSQRRIVFRMVSGTIKLTLTNKKKVKGVELKTNAALDLILQKIRNYNLESGHFIQRVPSLYSTKLAQFIFISVYAALTVLVLSTSATIEKKILLCFILCPGLLLLIVRRNIELREIRKTNAMD